ncbi:NXPE family member 3-like isoform X2 [Sebastes umbrosus]|uniref:NXPE family member 3-like isoform X2 n=1 Tax=Sebastes umbrosus TaxID=72105 RepID=UPI0018A04A16|nr:NXPE family member 3-like isoform X2 [Sebastes umbrosus]
MKARACIRKEYGVIFLFLAVFVLIYVLRNMDVLEFPHKVNSISIVPRVFTDPDKHRSFCTFQPLSREEALEERFLLDSIAWPETPLVSLEQTSDPAHSNFTILPARGGGQWHVGDQLEVMIQMSDFKGRPRKSGGDFLLARLHNRKIGAGVVGQVVDHLNGSYSAVFSLLWDGGAQVEVTLVHPVEVIPVLNRLNSEQPDRIYFNSLFRSGSVSETSICNVCLHPTQPLCNFTDVRTGEPWFCYKPKSLSCDARVNHAMGSYKENIKAEEKKLFQSGVNLKVYMRSSGPASVTVLPQKEDLKEFDLHSPEKAGPYMSLDYANNILLTSRFHGPPIRIVVVSASQLRYIANEIDGLIGGTNTVVVFGIWAHFGTFPMEIYIRRLQSIRRAVVRLLDRAPGTLVVIRTGNPKALSLTISLTNSDWHSWQCNKVLRAVFKGLNVHLIDAWEMTLAHHLPHDLHPAPPIIKNMVNVLLSYMCPQKGG